jgi:excisionase family DNA binding protein
MKDYLSIGEASRYCGLSISTLRRMEEDGRLEAHHRTFGRHRRYSLNQLNALVEKPCEDNRAVVAVWLGNYL